MGRQKITIRYIEEARQRQVTFLKRKKGLVKKAMELSKLCKCEMILLIKNPKTQRKPAQLYQFCTGDADEFLMKVVDDIDHQHKGNGERYVPADYDMLFGNKSGDEEEDEDDNPSKRICRRPNKNRVKKDELVTPRNAIARNTRRGRPSSTPTAKSTSKTSHADFIKKEEAKHEIATSSQQLDEPIRPAPLMSVDGMKKQQQSMESNNIFIDVNDPNNHQFLHLDNLNDAPEASITLHDDGTVLTDQAMESNAELWF